MKFHRLQTLQGSLQLPPDRAQAGAAAIFAALAEGKSSISPWPDHGDFLRIRRWLELAEISAHHNGSLLEIEGKGIRFPSSPEEAVPISTHAGNNLLIATWFTALLGNSVRFSGPPAPLKQLQHDLSPIRELHLSVAEGDLCIERTAATDHPSGRGVAARNHHLLLALLHRRPFLWKAPTVSGDPLTPLLQEFGLSIQLEEKQELDEQQNEGLEQLQALLQSLDADEAKESEKNSALERRLQRLSRRKPQNYAQWSLKKTELLLPAEISLLGDPSIAGLCAVLATHLPGSDLELEQICVTPSRAGLFTALGRLGGEQKRTRERKTQGESSANLRFRYHSKMAGRKFSEEQVLAVGDDLPLLAVAASFVQEESIFRGLSLKKGGPLAALADNLRSAGVEVGEFDDGLVLRGREELDAAEFSSEGDSSLALASAALALLAHGKSTLDEATVTLLEELWPGWHSILQELIYAT